MNSTLKMANDHSLDILISDKKLKPTKILQKPKNYILCSFFNYISYVTYGYKSSLMGFSYSCDPQKRTGLRRKSKFHRNYEFG